MEMTKLKEVALELARKEARSRGNFLRPFRQIAGYENQLGPEWVAINASGSRYASVFVPLGDAEMESAVAEAAFTWIIEGRLVAFSGNAFADPVWRDL